MIYFSRREYHSISEETTLRVGSTIADLLTPGTVVALIGNLGAGKTALSQAICAAMGVENQQVTSPTFVLIQEYAGRLPVYHFDTYRLRDEDEFLELGADEYLEGEGVCLIEWADRVHDLLPRDRVQIEITITGETTRAINISAHGPRSEIIVNALPDSVRIAR